MPDVGYTTIGADEFGTESQTRGSPATMPEAGALQSITAYIRESSTANAHTVVCAVYDSSLNLIATTNSLNNIPTTGGWHTFSFASPPALSAGTIYLAVSANNASGDLRVFYDAESSAGRDGGGNPPPDPWVPVTSDRRYSIYGTYTTEGGGGTGRGRLIHGKLVGGILVGVH